MTITLGWWALPTVITAAIWSWEITRPFPPSQGDYDFGGPLIAMLRIATCVVVTLVAWLAYFAARVFLGA